MFRCLLIIFTAIAVVKSASQLFGGSITGDKILKQLRVTEPGVDNQIIKKSVELLLPVCVSDI